MSQQLYDFALKSKPNQGHQMDQQFADAVIEQKQSGLLTSSSPVQDNGVLYPPPASNSNFIASMTMTPAEQQLTGAINSSRNTSVVGQNNNHQHYHSSKPSSTSVSKPSSKLAMANYSSTGSASASSPPLHAKTQQQAQAPPQWIGRITGPPSQQ